MYVESQAIFTDPAELSQKEIGQFWQRGRAQECHNEQTNFILATPTAIG